MALGIQSVIWGVITFSILVMLHEGGHFLAAKAFGVRVHEFMIGLPGPSISFVRKGTRFGLTAIPLGGYVRISGMEGDVHDPLLAPILTYVTSQKSVSFQDVVEQFSLEESAARAALQVLKDWSAVTVDEESDLWTSAYSSDQADSPENLLELAKQGTYLSLSPAKRIAMLMAGVAVNIATAIIVFSIVLAGWGMYKDAGGVAPVSGAPAYVAGVKAGDTVIKVGSESVDSFDKISAAVAKLKVGEAVEVTVLRGTDNVALSVKVGTNPDTGGPYLGIRPQLTHVKPNIFGAVAMSFGYVKMTVEALIGFFTPSSFAQSVSGSVSIVGISVIAAKAAQSGPLDYAWLIAAISLSLGLMNILPIPPLDGGKIVMEIIEAISKRPIPLKVSIAASLTGFGLLFSLMAYLMYADIARLVQ